MFFINWEKLKTFLIVLFAALNVFLVAFTAFQNAKYSRISDETINGTVKILKNKNINISADKILQKQVNLNVIELKNAVVSHSFPKGFSRADEKNFSLKAQGSISNEGEVKKVLSSIGIKGNNEIKIDGEKAYVYLKFGQYTVFDIFLTLTKQGDDVNVFGSWYFAENKPRKSSDMSEIVSLTGILVDFSNIAAPEKETDVEKIELGYYINESSRNIDKLNVTAFPCYRISTGDGKKYYFNARNGEFLNMV